MPKTKKSIHSQLMIVLLVGIMLVAFTVILGMILSSKKSSSYVVKKDDNKNAEIVAPTFTAPLTGLPVSEEISTRRPWAIVIENLPPIRPQSGLSAADIVFEAPTEGGITRFLAIFQSQLPPSLIGPIRSARPYFNDWSSTFQALYSHSGGTSEALKQLKGGYGSLTDVNEFYNEHAYQRIVGKKAPHNLFTTAEKFWKYITNLGWDKTSTATKLNFGTRLSDGTTATNFIIPYFPSEYAVRYDWRPNEKYYLRAVGGNTQFDATTMEPIHVTNAIVMFTDIIPIPRDPLFKVNLTTIGSGKILLFTNGQKYQGLWSKPTLESDLIFTDEAGNILPLTPGNTWISVVDNSLMNLIKTEPKE